NVGGAANWSPFGRAEAGQYARRMLDAVVAGVPNAFGFRAERCDESLRDQRAIRACPAHGEIVAAQILLRCQRVRRNAVAVMFICVIAQDLPAESARAAVDERDELLAANADALELGR